MTKQSRELKVVSAKLKELISRINGLSITSPVFGASINWTPPISERSIAESLMKFLNDRRMLYDLMNLEVLDYVAVSVLETRKRLAEYLDKVSIDSNIGQYIDVMQAACREFLTQTQNAKDWQIQYEALADLRTIFLVELSKMSIAYNVKPGRALVDLLPSLDTTNPKQEALLKLLLREPLLQASTTIPGQ